MSEPAARLGRGKEGAPAFALRGIVEGFYGRPWTHEQRLDMIEFIADRGMNTFVYSPKDDPLVRRDWRQPYSGAELERLSELAASCRLHGLDFVYCLSPGLSIQYSSQGDIAELCAKFDSVARLGVGFFGLLLDDIPLVLQHAVDRKQFDDLADAHSHIVQEVFTQLQQNDARHRLVVCPTVYRGYGDEPYVARLGRGIDPRIEFFWTGRAICSATIDLADAAVISRTIARPVTYWDNYPVNDVAMGGELHIGPYRGRDRHLARFSAGVIANGMELFESSKIAFATIADYLWAPEQYDPEASWAVALRDVVGSERDLAAFALFADNVRSSCLSQEDAPLVSAAIEQFSFAHDTGDPVAASTALISLADQLCDAADRLIDGDVTNPDLIAEAMPWLTTFRIGAVALKRLAELSTVGQLDDAARQELAGYLEQFRRQNRRVFGDVLTMTLTDATGSPG
ncbi:MAG: protein O-GlcNAcase [Pseudolysinimonas sp.]